jgi:hypothetical protein
MNFLSHYYFDRDTTNCYHTLGTVLPDLLKNADKTINIHPEKLHHPDKNINDILLGWHKHLEVDRFFHSSGFFIERSHAIKNLLAPAITGSPVKPFFQGHIALEIMLDNLLITNNKASVDDFYSHLNSCKTEVIKEFLNFSGLKDTDRFFKFYDGFKTSRYLESYIHNHQVTYALKRICMRVWHDPFTPEQEERMTRIITAYRSALQVDFMSIFDYISKLLSPD